MEGLVIWNLNLKKSNAKLWVGFYSQCHERFLKLGTLFMFADGAFCVQESLLRLPLKMEPPEKVLCQAHGQARSIADFLHENGELICYAAMCWCITVIALL